MAATLHRSLRRGHSAGGTPPSAGLRFRTGNHRSVHHDQFRLGAAARNARDHDALLDELTALPNVTIDHRVESKAIAAQRQLAPRGSI
jgi:hypothetical protein